MTSKLITYRIQLFILALSSAIFSFQLEPFLSSRGVSTSTVITVYSIAQIISIAFTLLWAKLVHESNRGHVIVRIGVLIRICIIGLMFICFNINLLVCLVFMYYTVASCLDIANEARVMKWSSEQNQNFGKIRLFGSLGYAASGLVATTIIAMTGKIDYVILFAFLINIIVVSLSFYRPLKHLQLRKKVQQKFV